MNKLLIPIVALIIFACSCSGMMEMKRIDAAQVETIYDSLKTIPGTYSMHVLQDDDYSKVTVILGNRTLYSSGKERITEASLIVGTMLVNILGPEASISKATFVVTQKDTDATAVPEDGISTEIKIDSIKKAIYKK